MAIPVIVKAAPASDKRGRKFVAAGVGLFFLPMIFALTAIIGIISGVGESSKNMLDYSFNSELELTGIPDEQKAQIAQMRGYLEKMDKAIEKNGSKKLDKRLVKAVFYCLYFGVDLKGKFDYDEFVEAFKNISWDNLERKMKILKPKNIDPEVEENLIPAIRAVYDYLEENDL